MCLMTRKLDDPEYACSLLFTKVAAAFVIAITLNYQKRASLPWLTRSEPQVCTDTHSSAPQNISCQSRQ